MSRSSVPPQAGVATHRPRQRAEAEVVRVDAEGLLYTPVEEGTRDMEFPSGVSALAGGGVGREGVTPLHSQSQRWTAPLVSDTLDPPLPPSATVRDAAVRQRRASHLSRHTRPHRPHRPHRRPRRRRDESKRLLEKGMEEGMEAIEMEGDGDDDVRGSGDDEDFWSPSRSFAPSLAPRGRRVGFGEDRIPADPLKDVPQHSFDAITTDENDLDGNNNYRLHFFEYVGGLSRLHHWVPLVLHSGCCIASIVCYCQWNGGQKDYRGLSDTLNMVYFTTIIVGCFAHVFLASPLYAWAWRYPEPEEVAKRRCTMGASFDLFLGDIPNFIVETRIVYQKGYDATSFAVTYTFRCVTFFYTALRVWLFLLQRIAKLHHVYVSQSAPPYKAQALKDSASLSFAYRLYSQPGTGGGGEGGGSEGPLEKGWLDEKGKLRRGVMSSSSRKSSCGAGVEEGNELLVEPPLGSPLLRADTERHLRPPSSSLGGGERTAYPDEVERSEEDGGDAESPRRRHQTSGSTPPRGTAGRLGQQRSGPFGSIVPALSEPSFLDPAGSGGGQRFPYPLPAQHDTMEQRKNRPQSSGGGGKTEFASSRSQRIAHLSTREATQPPFYAPSGPPHASHRSLSTDSAVSWGGDPFTSRDASTRSPHPPRRLYPFSSVSGPPTVGGGGGIRREVRTTPTNPHTTTAASGLWSPGGGSSHFQMDMTWKSSDPKRLETGPHPPAPRGDHLLRGVEVTTNTTPLRSREKREEEVGEGRWFPGSPYPHARGSGQEHHRPSPAFPSLLHARDEGGDATALQSSRPLVSFDTATPSASSVAERTPGREDHKKKRQRKKQQLLEEVHLEEIHSMVQRRRRSWEQHRVVEGGEPVGRQRRGGRRLPPDEEVDDEEEEEKRRGTTDDDKKKKGVGRRRGDDLSLRYSTATGRHAASSGPPPSWAPPRRKKGEEVPPPAVYHPPPRQTVAHQRGGAASRPAFHDTYSSPSSSAAGGLLSSDDSGDRRKGEGADVGRRRGAEHWSATHGGVGALKPVFPVSHYPGEADAARQQRDAVEEKRFEDVF